MVVRELLARFGISYDNTGFKKTEGAIGRLSTGVSGLAKQFGGLFAGIATGIGIRGLIKLGEEAENVGDVLEFVFKQNTNAVKAWADAYGKDVGRSKYELMGLASDIGTFLNPIMGDNVAATTEMSKKMSELATDMAVLKNIDKETAMQALRAGLAGQARGLKQFGIILDTTKKKKEGLAGATDEEGESTATAKEIQERYNEIMKKSITIQGYAKAQAGDFDNAIEGLKSQFKDLAMDLMLRIMPALGRFTTKLRIGMRPIVEAIKKSNLFSAALIMLGTVATIVGVRLLLAFIPAILPFVAIALVLDEIITLFKGGKTVAGKFIDKLFGLGATQKYVDNYNAGLKVMGEYFDKLPGKISAFMVKFKEAWSGPEIDVFIEKLKFVSGWNGLKFLAESAEQLLVWLTGVNDIMDIFIEKLKFILGIKGIEFIIKSVKGMLPSDEYGEELDRRASERAKGRGVDAGVYKGPSFGQANAEKAQSGTPEQGIPWSVDPGIAKQKMRGPVTNNSSSAQSVNQSVSITNNVTAPANSSPERVAREVGKATQRAITNQPKNILGALKQGI